ncbi:AIM24 family protein [Bacillus spongiae]|uniref:AIM24 family protein n=1 Tax=Bacillus spongiae TaxID=2683610 RepID=A0ABU8HDK0_9BACI
MDNRYSVQEFIQKTKQEDKGQGLFELETERILEINLDGDIWAKAGGMISYRGDIKFVREGILEHGIGKFFKKALTGEGTSLMKASGNGKLYLADQGKKISIINLEGESIYVNGNDLLAFESNLDWDIKLMKKVAGMLAGGLFNVRIEGSGMVAVTSHYEPLTLLVEPGSPVYTDPNATVAWSGNLQPEFVTDVSLKTFFGRGSGESIQMKFEGSGFVVVQPYEEFYAAEQQ